MYTASHPTSHFTHSLTRNAELWRLLGAFESLGRVASANEEEVRRLDNKNTAPHQTINSSPHINIYIHASQLLQGCPIDRRTARVLVDFLDGRRALGKN